MTLTDLWTTSRGQLEGKQIQQIIAFAGDGRLRDASTASLELRAFLSHVPSSVLRDYVSQCLKESFTDSGFALQDLVNQIGRRLGYEVTDGRYRGTAGQTGYDGIWRFADGQTVIIEVKTTDAYQITLDTLARYRRELIAQNACTEEGSSILIVLGRADKDTSDLEAQIRGSRHAWNIRLISVEALARLMALQEEVEDPQLLGRISQILLPREFTKLDDIIELVFFTAEDIKQDEPEDDETIEEQSERGKPVAFYDTCIKRLETHLKQSLIRRTRTSYSTPDDNIRLALALSKAYERGGQNHFWFAFHPHQADYLERAKDSYVAFGCGSEKTLVSIPLSELRAWLPEMHKTESKSRSYWHINITQDGKRLTLIRKKGTAKIDLERYLI